MDYDDYLNHRKDLDLLRVSQINTFDKTVLALSSSAIGLSIALVSGFDKLQSNLNETYCILAASWFLYTFAILLNLTSYLLAANSLQIEINELDESIKKDESKENSKIERNRFVSLTNGSNIVSLMLFSLATILLLIFAVANISIGEEHVENFSRKIITLAYYRD